MSFPRLKGLVKTAVRVQPDQTGAEVILALAESPTQQDLAIRQDRDTFDRAVHQRACQGGIQAAVGVDPGEAAPSFAAHPIEAAADEDLAVRLGRQGANLPGMPARAMMLLKLVLGLPSAFRPVIPPRG